MYLTAQRVLSSQGENAINAFYYKHGDILWPRPPPSPVNDPGTLFNTIVVLPQGGNKVLSYLDIVAPDETPWDDIATAIVSAFPAREADGRLKPLPWVASEPALLSKGGLWFQLALSLPYARRWGSEAGLLYRACTAVHKAEAPTTP